MGNISIFLEPRNQRQNFTCRRGVLPSLVLSGCCIIAPLQLMVDSLRMEILPLHLPFWYSTMAYHFDARNAGRHIALPPQLVPITPSTILPIEYVVRNLLGQCICHNIRVHSNHPMVKLTNSCLRLTRWEQRKCTDIYHPKTLHTNYAG